MRTTLNVSLDIEVDVEGVMEQGESGNYLNQPIGDMFIIHSIKWHGTDIMDLLEKEKYDIEDMAIQIMEKLDY